MNRINLLPSPEPMRVGPELAEYVAAQSALASVTSVEEVLEQHVPSGKVCFAMLQLSPDLQRFGGIEELSTKVVRDFTEAFLRDTGL